MTINYIFLLYIAGVLTGFIIGGVYLYTKTSTGVLRIDRANPEKDIYRLDIDDLTTLSDKKVLKLKIDHNADLSQN